MTAQLLFEEESGTSTGHRHPHNGYYAGDFAVRADAFEQSAHQWVPLPSARW